MVEWLLACGAEVAATDYREFTPLHYATSRETAAALLAKGANINARPNTYSMTPLAAAAQRGNAEVVAFLLENGADASLADDMVFTPLHWAAWAGSKETVKLLLPKTPHWNGVDHSGWTARDWAACRGYADVVEVLIGWEQQQKKMKGIL